MTKIEAIELLRKYADHQEPFWGCTPEGRIWMSAFSEAIKVLSDECARPNTDFADNVTIAMRRAWFLGQEYWRLADSENHRGNRKSYEVSEKFHTLTEETRELVLTWIGEC